MKENNKDYRELSNYSKIINKELYLDILSKRIEDNRRLVNKLLLILLLCLIAFPLIAESKISEISLGPFKLSDNIIAIGLIPSIFSFTYYKLTVIRLDLSEHKIMYEILCSKIFSIEKESFLVSKLTPRSLLDLSLSHIINLKHKKLAVLTMLIYLPIALFFIISPFFFEFYAIKELYLKFGFDGVLETIIIVFPSLIGFYTFYTLILNSGKKYKI